MTVDKTKHLRQDIPWLDLTPKQLEIVDWAVKGCYSSREIAEILYLSPKTVEHHLNHTYSKLKISSRAELVYFGMRDQAILDQLITQHDHYKT